MIPMFVPQHHRTSCSGAQAVEKPIGQVQDDREIQSDYPNVGGVAERGSQMGRSIEAAFCLMRLGFIMIRA